MVDDGHYAWIFIFIGKHREDACSEKFTFPLIPKTAEKSCGYYFMWDLAGEGGGKGLVRTKSDDDVFPLFYMGLPNHSIPAREMTSGDGSRGDERLDLLTNLAFIRCIVS